ESQEMICGGRYFSCDDAMRVFAGGSLTNEMRIEVRWRSGKRSVVNGVKANRIYEIEEADAEPASFKLQAPGSKETSNSQLPTSNSETKPVFVDVSRLIGHVHHDEPFDDFARQRLLPRRLSQLGPGVAWCDVNADGWEDLIVGSGRGGRFIPGRYPEAGSSMFFRDEGGRWELDAENTKRLAKAGLVSGAIWSDLDGDGLPELILACEWGPLRIFRNHAGRLTETTEAWGLGKYYGWWNGVTAGDFDGDGKMDIIASNWGRNTKYQRYSEQPARIFYGDFHRDGTVEVVEASFDPGLNKIVPWRDLDAMTKALPFVREKFQTCRAYSRASVQEILGDEFSSAAELKAGTLDSMVFLNRGGRFDARPLPVEAQFAPAFAICVGDYDGDGRADVFLSQNLSD